MSQPTRPKILFLCTACPFGTSGSGQRTLHIGRLLERIGPVTMVVASGREWSEAQMNETRATFHLAEFIKYEESRVRGIKERWRQVFDPRFLNTNGVIVPSGAQARLYQLAADHDVIWIHTQKLANAFRRFHWPKSIIDVDDYPSRFHASAIPHSPWVVPKLRRIRNAFAWRRREAVWAERFSILTVCKEADRAHFGAGPRVHVVPNGFAPPAFLPAPAARSEPCLGMIGDFTYLPNHNGLRWFQEHCWPEVRQRVPHCTLRLIGKASDEIAKSFRDDRIVGLGYVPDTGVEMAGWSGMIVPTRLGGGTHLKIAEGLARRVPIVTTPHGARGYTIMDGEHALIAAEAPAFTDGCVQLLTKPDLGRRLTAAGWDLFNRSYSWDSIQPAVETAVQHCLSLGNDLPFPRRA